MNVQPIKSTLTALAKRAAKHLLIAVLIALPVRQCVAMPVVVSGDSVSPEVPHGSHALVYRLASDFQPGDIIAYKAADKMFLGRFASTTAEKIHLVRNAEALDITREQVIGKIVIGTR